MYVSLQISQTPGGFGRKGEVHAVTVGHKIIRVIHRVDGVHVKQVGIEEYTKTLVMRTLTLSSTRWRSNEDVTRGNEYVFIRDKYQVKHIVRNK